VDNLILWDEIPDYEDVSNSEREQVDELSLDISEVQLARWAAELDENVEQDEEQAARTETIQRPFDEPDLSNDEPIQLEDDISEFPIELEDPLPAETIEDLLIPAPDEFESTNHADRNAGLSDHLDLVGCFGADQDFSLSLDLARAYLEVGDEEGAEEILKQALAGAPDPETRRQTEELLARIESLGRTKASHIP
jgi:FimV-like protein